MSKKLESSIQKNTNERYCLLFSNNLFKSFTNSLGVGSRDDIYTNLGISKDL